MEITQLHAWDKVIHCIIIRTVISSLGLVGLGQYAANIWKNSIFAWEFKIYNMNQRNVINDHKKTTGN